MKKTVGFIGLGTMGKSMAHNALDEKFSLIVHDTAQQPVQELVSEGARAAGNIKEIAALCNWIVLVLPDTQIVKSVLFEPDGLQAHLQPGQIVIDCGTTHPDFTKEAAQTLAKNNIDFLDAPVSGMQSRAEAGTLTVMVGGNERAFNTVHPLLNAIGEHIFYLGPSGNGQLAKIINNTFFNISCAAMAELLPFAVKLGLDPEIICDIVSSGSGQSYGFDFFSRLALQRNFGPGYPMQKAFKDLETIGELANREHAPLPVASATRKTYQMALEQNLGHLNKGAMIKVWEHLLNVKVQSPRNNP
ncbi:MAG: NAD(P)-dependent oxidoreductase [bacterium]|nr:NAD(P)-dependent oxidoreductase [bacterium]